MLSFIASQDTSWGISGCFYPDFDLLETPMKYDFAVSSTFVYLLEKYLEDTPGELKPVFNYYSSSQAHFH